MVDGVFCHGVPGSPLDQTLNPAFNNWAALDLLAHQMPLESAVDEFDTVTDQGPPLPVAGFSIGAMFALHLAAMRPQKVSKLILISPAAPLQLGTFLPDMAGRPVFELAAKRPRVLRALTVVQALLLRFAPDLLIRQLFATAGAQERQLLEDPGFRNTLKHGLQQSYLRNRKTYLAAVQAYVADWRPVLSQITCPVEIWHGDQDGWAPFAMAKALEMALPGQVTLHKVKGAEHYSTLLEFCQQEP